MHDMTQGWKSSEHDNRSPNGQSLKRKQQDRFQGFRISSKVKTLRNMHVLLTRLDMSSDTSQHSTHHGCSDAKELQWEQGRQDIALTAWCRFQMSFSGRGAMSPGCHWHKSGWLCPRCWPAAGCHSLCTWPPRSVCPQAAPDNNNPQKPCTGPAACSAMLVHPCTWPPTSACPRLHQGCHSQ